MRLIDYSVKRRRHMAGGGTAQSSGAAQGLAAVRARLRVATLRPEMPASCESVADLGGEGAALARAGARATRWVEVARADTRSRPLVERMLEQFPLDSVQGKALMSLAEVLLRK